MSLNNTMPVFPIKSNTACILKWSWSTVYLYRGTTSSCHRVNQDHIPKGDVQNFHNTPAKLTARELMKNGQWPGQGCEYCANIEKVGGLSDRMMQLEHSQHMIPPELEHDAARTVVTPRLLEIYFNNTCNMSCLYCGPHFSSRWEEENRRFGMFQQEGVIFGSNENKREDYAEMLSGLWAWMEEHSQHLRHFQILGGEPFFQTELDDCIEFWSQHPNPNVVFNIITNLKVPKKKFQDYLEKFDYLAEQGCIKELQISGSIDAWGPQQEYTRYGLDLSEWEENWNLLLERPSIVLSINQAISALTIKTMPDLLMKLNQWRKQHEIFHSFMSVMSPNLLNPEIVGHGTFEDDFDKILRLMPDQDLRDRTIKQHMAGIASNISSRQRDHAGIRKIKIYLDEIDRRRNTNWKLLFPWLDALG